MPPAATPSAASSSASSDATSPDAEPASERAFLRSVLHSNPLFSRVDDASHREQLVKAFQRKRYAHGDLMVAFGERGDRFYVLEEGEAAVEIPQTQPTEVLTPGQHEGAAGSATSASAASASVAAADSPAQAVVATPQIVAAEATSSSVRVDLLERGSSFGEVSLLYDVERCASVRCVTPQCVAWSVDAATFREHSKSGSLMLRSIFERFASVRVEGTAAGGSKGSGSSNASCLPDGTPITESFMNMRDFVSAIEHSKGISAIQDRVPTESEEGAATEGEDDSVPDAQRDMSYFRAKLARLLRKKTPEELAATSQATAEKKKHPLANLTPHRLSLIFRLADSSGDHLLSFGEFVILHSLLSQPHSELQMAFRLFDRDKNGAIDRSEFIAAMRALARDRGEKLNFENDPLVKELFGPGVQRLKRDVLREARAESRALAWKEEKDDEQERAGGVRGFVYDRYERIKSWWMFSLFHSRSVLVKPTAPAPPDPTAVPAAAAANASAAADNIAGGPATTAPSLPVLGAKHDVVPVTSSSSSPTQAGQSEEEEYVLEYKTLSYEQFERLLKRKVLPQYLKEITQDLRAIDRFWEGSDAPFSLSAMEDGFGSSLNLETLAKDNLPTVTSAHVMDSERLLMRAHLPWKNLLAGGIAGAVSRSLLAPIERLKLLFQMQSSNAEDRRYTGIKQGLRQMYKDDGARGLFKGNGANILRVVPVVALQFFFYDLFKRHMFGPWRNEDSVPQRLVAGASAGMLACVITYPLDTVRARLTLQRNSSASRGAASGSTYNGLLHSFSSIYRTEGLRGFYHGLVPSMVGVIPYVGLDFAVYETLKKALPRDEHDECSRVHLFVCGAAAGVVGQTIAYPLDLVRRRMQVYGWAGSGETTYTHNYHRGTFIDALRIIRHEEGYRGLYKGIGLNYIKVVPAVSIAFMVYERVRAKLDEYTR